MEKTKLVFTFGNGGVVGQVAKDGYFRLTQLKEDLGALGVMTKKHTEDMVSHIFTFDANHPEELRFLKWLEEQLFELNEPRALRLEWANYEVLFDFTNYHPQSVRNILSQVQEVIQIVEEKE